MLNYFVNNPDADTRYVTKKYFKMNVLKKMYLQELSKVKDYYRNREYRLSNKNILVRLIKTLSRDISLPVLDYLGYIDTDAPYLVKQFGFISNISHGKLLRNVIFSGDSNELFLYIDTALDPYLFEKEWVGYESVRVIKTDITDVYYPVIFRYNKYTPDVSVFEIDIKALMLQYYYWAKKRIKEDRSIDVNVFLPMVVLPNISDSLIDMAIWNRYTAKALNLEISDTDTKHPISLIDYTTGIDGILDNVIKDTTNKSIYITQLLRTIPTILSEDMYGTLYINKNYYNKRSRYVLYIARLADIVMIHTIIGKKGYRLNRDLFNRLPYQIKILARNDSEYSDILDIYNSEILREQITYIGENIGKR